MGSSRLDALLAALDLFSLSFALLFRSLAWSGPPPSACDLVLLKSSALLRSYAHLGVVPTVPDMLHSSVIFLLRGVM